VAEVRHKLQEGLLQSEERAFDFPNLWDDEIPEVPLSEVLPDLHTQRPRRQTPRQLRGGRPPASSAAAASTCAHPAAAAADPPPAPRRPSGRINFPPELCPPEAELDDWTRIKKAFDSKQLVSSGSTFRPPGRSRSRSPPFPKRASPAEVPAVPAVIRPDVSRIDWAGMGLRPQQALGYSRIDWAEMGRETQQKRVAVLQEILNDPRISSDSFKMLLVGEKMDNFQQEDELLRRIQGLEATDLPPPGTPQEHNRKIQVAMLLEELLMTRTLLYHVVGP